MNYIQKRYILLAITSTACVFLLAGRIYVSGNLNFTFLIWNLLLAWIPLYFSHKFKRSFGMKKHLFSGFLFLCWLVIFPNAPYIITDLVHLEQKEGVPLWFDLILLVSFAWNGLLTGFISLMEVHQAFLTRFSQKISWGLISGILFLSAYGVYLGRFERWNSWDILTHPFSLVYRMIDNFQHLDTLMRSMGVTFCFGLFLMISYGTLYFLSSTKEKQ